jgi:osmotically inducible protein OsmC
MASLKRHANAVWAGTGKEGTGALTTQSGALHDAPYGFNTRFGNTKGTNPEELIAAAHAGCFTMALAFALTAAGHTAQQLTTEAVVFLDQEGAGFRISKVELALQAKVPGLDQAGLEKIAGEAKAGCPVSKLLNAEITLTTKLG